MTRTVQPTNYAQRWQADRNTFARRMMDTRRALIESGSTGPRASRLVRKLFAQERAKFRTDIPKPTRAALLARLRDLEAYAASPIVDHSTEYYSACGLDDMQAEQREYAAEEARALRAEIYANH